MKASFKPIVLSLILLIRASQALIAIKRLTQHELDNFVLYRSRSLVSSYKIEEKVRTPTLLNYLPVKIKLLGGPKIEIIETPNDE